jgi:hypothetical protein
VIRRLLPALVALSVAAPAHAREKVELTWQLPEVFSAALRFVRIDRGCKLTDKDEVAAFLLFECPPDEKGQPVKRGSVELYRVEVRGAQVVRVQVSLAEEPAYMEKRFLDLLERKLRQELGSPPAPRPTPPRPPADAPDGGA